MPSLTARPLGAGRGVASIRPLDRSHFKPAKWPPAVNVPDPPVEALSPPSREKLPVFAAERGQSPERLGLALRELVDENLAQDGPGTLLVKGMPTDTPASFASVMHACARDDWTRRAYESMWGPRDMVDGIDLATNIPAHTTLLCHNEMVYNHNPPGIFVFACHRPADEGGDSLLAHNADYNAHVSQELQDFVQQHGGVRYMRRYHDGAKPAPEGQMLPTISWQERANLTEGQGREDAEQYFVDNLFMKKEDMSWGDDGSLTIYNTETGYNNRGEWCNVLVTMGKLGLATAGDGTPFPEHLLQGQMEAEAQAYHCFKLEAGDVWVVDNMRVAHGRLPFVESDPKRTLYTYMADAEP